MSRTVSAILGIPAMTMVLACGAFASYAQEGELPATDGAFYARSVRNIDKAVAWYTKHLGFKLESQGGNDQRRGALLSRPGAVLELGEFAAAVAQEEIRPGLESHEVYGIETPEMQVQLTVLNGRIGKGLELDRAATGGWC